jgi:8-oxo-dGTP pyrophosphatase MutT (NUDIX family)
MAPGPSGSRDPLEPAPSPRQSAVLLLLFPAAEDLALVLIRRSQQVYHHRGQIALPGGSQEAGDGSLWCTALRETQEELGVGPEAVVLLGQLTPLYISGSHFQVQPFVGYVAQAPVWSPEPVEVDEVLELPLARLSDPSIKRVGEWSYQQGTRRVPYYQAGAHAIWGATAMMLSEFEAVLARSTVLARSQEEPTNDDAATLASDFSTTTGSCWW